jgi:hypothetical protein
MEELTENDEDKSENLQELTNKSEFATSLIFSKTGL